MPRVVDKQEKKREILRAAITVFARNGVDRTKMADIAVEAAIGKGTIYEYFRSKEELFGAAFDFFQIEFSNQLAEQLDRVQDPVQKLILIFEMGYTVFVDEYRDFSELMMEFWAEGVRKKDKDLIKWIDLNKTYAGFRQLFIRLLQEGIALGRIRPVDVQTAASALIALLDGLFIQWIVDRHAVDLRKTYQQAIRYFLDGILLP